MEIAQPAVNATVPPGAPVSFVVNDAQVAFTVAPWAVEVRPLSCRQSQTPGTAEIQVGLRNVGTGAVSAPFTVSFESVIVAGQPVPDLTFTVPFDLLSGPTVDVPAHGVWIVTAASGAQIAGTVNVRQGSVAIASRRPRACQVP